MVLVDCVRAWARISMSTSVWVFVQPRNVSSRDAHILHWLLSITIEIIGNIQTQFCVYNFIYQILRT